MAKYFLKLGDREIEAEVEDGADSLRVNLGDGWREVAVRRLGSSPRFALTVDRRTYDVLARDHKDGIEVILGGVSYSIATVRPRRGRAPPEEEGEGHFENGVWQLKSPQTGSVVDIRVSLGDRVEQGAILMVVEAMKMQNELRSRVAGIISAITAERGQRVETGAVLMELSAPEEPA